MPNLLTCSIIDLNMEYIDSLIDDDMYGSFVLGFGRISGNFKPDFYGYGKIKQELIKYLGSKYQGFIYQETTNEIEAYISLCDYYHNNRQYNTTHPVPPTGVRCPHCYPQ